MSTDTPVEVADEAIDEELPPVADVPAGPERFGIESVPVSDAPQ